MGLLCILFVKYQNIIMIKIINEKIYSTKDSERLTDVDNGLPETNFDWTYEILYRTKKETTFWSVLEGLVQNTQMFVEYILTKVQIFILLT